MSRRSAPLREFRIGRDISSANPFHSDRPAESCENRCLLEWRGAALSAGSYEATTGARLRSKNTHDLAVILLRGQVHSQVGEADRSAFRFGATRSGQVSVYPLATMLDFTVSHSRIATCELHFPPQFAQDQLGFGDDRPLRHQLGRPDPFLFNAVTQIFTLEHQNDDISLLQKDSVFHALALHLFASYGDGTVARSRPPVAELTALRARQLRGYIDDALHRRLHGDELAQLAGCDRREFPVVFRNAFGVTLTQYIIDRRLDRATELLTDTRLDLAEVAIGVGFSSQSHLTSTLQKRRGVTPSQLRKRSARTFLAETA